MCISSTFDKFLNCFQWAANNGTWIIKKIWVYKNLTYQNKT